MLAIIINYRLKILLPNDTESEEALKILDYVSNDKNIAVKKVESINHGVITKGSAKQHFMDIFVEGDGSPFRVFH